MPTSDRVDVNYKSTISVNAKFYLRHTIIKSNVSLQYINVRMLKT